MAKYSQTNRTDFKTNKDEAKNISFEEKDDLEVRN
jgi:cbb3-type cytochrome oxidase subunit 3